MDTVARPKVFMSVGRTETSVQDAFVAAIERCLQDEGLEVVRARWSSEQPLKPVWRKMQECAGTAVIAFERQHFDEGVEFRGSPKQEHLANISKPTIWNQIEAAMAYTLQHPLFVIVQEGLQEEGLLEARYDWYVLRVRLDADVLSDREFRGVLADWKHRVEERHSGVAGEKEKTATGVNPENLTVGQLVAALKPAQLWTIIGALVTALVGIFSAALKFAQTGAPK